MVRQSSAPLSICMNTTCKCLGTAQLAKQLAQVAGLEKDIADNEKMREEATTLRDKEKEEFETTEAVRI